MNQPTITGSTDSNGLFTAENPYNKPTGFTGGTPITQWNEFENTHPPLFCYNENNVLVKGVEGLEVKGPIWQKWFKELQQWEPCDDGSIELELYRGDEYPMEKRQVYIAVQPTQKAEPELIKGNNYILDKDFNVSCEVTLVDFGKVYATVKNSDGTGREWQTMKNRLTPTPLPEAQQLEGVKTAKEILEETDDYDNYGNGISIDAIIRAMHSYHAQFATVAGGGKGNPYYYEQNTQDDMDAADGYKMDFDKNFGHNIPEHRKNGFLDGCRWKAHQLQLQAPSTHSSSEMVEVKKVVALVNSFFDNSTTISNAVAFLVEDIRALTK